jgi:hypothetical protein
LPFFAVGSSSSLFKVEGFRGGGAASASVLPIGL